MIQKKIYKSLLKKYGLIDILILLVCILFFIFIIMVMNDFDLEMFWENLNSDCFPSELLENSPKAIRDNKGYVMEALNRHPGNYFYVSNRLKNDLDVTMFAVKMDGENYEFIPKKLKKDKNIILEVVKTPGAWGYVPEELLNDKDIKKAIEKTRKKFGDERKYYY